MQIVFYNRYIFLQIHEVMGILASYLFIYFVTSYFIRFASIKSLKIHLLNDTVKRSLIISKFINIILFGFFLILFAPLKNKNKICIKQVKGLQKNFLQHFFFFFFFFFLVVNFVLLLFGPRLKYRKNKSAKGSFELMI